MNFVNRLQTYSFLLSTALAASCMISVSHASAIDSQAPKFSLSNTERTEATNVRKILSKYTYSLNRELATFHYQTAESPQSYRPSSLDEIIRSSATWGNNFYDSNFFGSDVVGPGHYVSTDLSGSRVFGGVTDPQLYVTILKPTAIILDGRMVFDGELDSLKQTQKTLGCLTPNPSSTDPNQLTAGPTGESVEEWLAFFRNSTTESCRKIVIQALAELNVDAILYNYDATNGLAHCRHDRTEALSIVSANAFDVNQLAYFSKERAFDPNDIGGKLAQLYNEGLNDPIIIASTTAQLRSMPLSLSKLTSSSFEYEKWKANFIYKCGAKWTNEIQNSKFQDIGAEARRPETLALVLEVSKAFTNRIDQKKYTMGFAVGLMRGYNEILARSQGLPLDVWVKALIPYHAPQGSNSSQNYLNLARALGEEPTRKIDLNDPQYLKEAIDALAYAPKEPQLAYSAFAKLGLGPRLTTLMINEFLTDVGGVPFLAGSLPTQGPANQAAFMKENLRIYTSYLRNCLREYRNENLSSDQLMAGACGLVQL